MGNITPNPERSFHRTAKDGEIQADREYHVFTFDHI